MYQNKEIHQNRKEKGRRMEKDGNGILKEKFEAERGS